MKLYPNDYAKTTEPCCVIVDTEWLDVVFYILERDLKERTVKPSVFKRQICVLYIINKKIIDKE